MAPGKFRKLLCRIGRHDWKVDAWIPVTGGKAIARYRCSRCGQARNVWQRWPATRRLEQP